MAITIKTIDNTNFTVNDKTVFLDRNGNWVTVSQLTTEEERAFINFRTAYIETGNLPNTLEI